MSHPAPEPWSFVPDSAFGRPIVVSPAAGLVATVEAVEFGPLIALTPEMYGLLRRVVSLRRPEDFPRIVTESLALIEVIEGVPHAGAKP